MTEIQIYGPIGLFGVTAAGIQDLVDQAQGDDLLVRINSAGGDFNDGPAIFTILSRYKGRVITQVDGIAYSMAAMILQAGDVRRMAGNSIVMVHGAQSFADGSSEELRKQAEIMDVHTEAIVGAFTKKGISEEKARGWLQDGDDHYFTAAQALDENLIDEVNDEIDLSAAMRGLTSKMAIPSILAAYRPNSGANSMPNDAKNTDVPRGTDNEPIIDVDELKRKRDRNVNAGLQAGRKEEMKRQNDIRLFFERPQFSDPTRIGEENVRVFQDLRDKCLSNSAITYSAARDAALDAQDGMSPQILSGEPAAPAVDIHAAGGNRQSFSARPGLDARDKFISGVTEALMVKAGVETDQEKKRKAAENEFLSMSVYEMCRVHNEINGIKGGLRRSDVVGSAITASGIAHGPSDFSNILENVASKALMRGWDEAGETWNQWARSGTLPDFKQGSRVNLSTFGDLDIVYRNGEYKYGSFSDLKEVLQLATYGKLFGISRQALIDDDLNALSAIPRAMGRAAARKIGDLAYNALTSNPVLNQDNTPVFDAGHNNIGTPGPISVVPGESLDEAWTAMGLQTDPQGTTLNIEPMHLVVPKAREISTRSMIADATYHYASAAQNRENPFRDRLMVSADARLDQVSATAWYVLADKDMHDTIEVAFLNGQETPYLESMDGWRVDGVEYKVRIDAVAAPLDFRTMFYNAGA